MLQKRKHISKRHRVGAVQVIQELTSSSLFEKLQSGGHETDQALCILSNVPVLPPELQIIDLANQLIKIIRIGQLSTINLALYAIANVCQIQKDFTKIVFESKLDQALVQLDSNELKLLEPILVLLLNAFPQLPEEYHYIITGLQGVLSNKHLESQCGQLVLQFLMRTGCNNVSQSVQDYILNTLNIFNRQRACSLCIGIILNVAEVQQLNQTISQCLVHFYIQLLSSIDLIYEYQNNIKPMIDETEQIDQTDHHNNQQNKFNHKQQDLFNDSVQAIEIAYECLADHLGDIQESNTNIQLVNLLVNIAKQSKKSIINNLNLRFDGAQGIIQNALRIILRTNLFEKYQDLLIIPKLVEHVLQQNYQSTIQILSMLFNIVLQKDHTLLTQQILLQIAQSTLSIKKQSQKCWILLLQLISKQFHGQNPLVTQQNNYRCAVILMNLLKNIPYTQVQQWRAQTIDTLFDVFCNERFNSTFVQLDFLPFLHVIISHVTIPNKNDKFVRQVLQDIQRFMRYKKQTIHSN